MEGTRASLLLVVAITWITSSHGISLIDTVKITECVPGKYFWRASQPITFYACLNNWPQRAIKMKCSEGTYMCNTGEKAFKPCQCRGLKKDDPDSSDPLTEAGQPKKEQTQTSEKKQNGGSLDDFAKMGADRTVLSAQGCDNGDSYQVTRDHHMTNGIPQDIDNLADCQWECLMYAKSKMCEACGSYRAFDTTPDIIAAHCRQQEEATIWGDNWNPNVNTLSDTCFGMDWVTDDFVLESDTRCFFITAVSRSMGATLRSLDNVDHYEKVFCASTPVPDTNTRSSNGGAGNDAGDVTPTTEAPDANGLNRRNGGPGIRIRVNLGENTGQPANRNANAGISGGTTPADDTASMAPTTPGPEVPEEGAAGAAGNSNRAQPTANPGMMQTTTTIPDSGCPYTFEAYEGFSHPYGKNVTDGNVNDEVEECKHWCLIRGFCKAVDFNFNTKTCYYLREINTLLVTNVAAVTHYRKTSCEPPLRCWANTVVPQDEADLSISNPGTPMTECSGYCFTSQTMNGNGQVIERGCLNVDELPSAPPLGCFVSENLMTTICYCDTPRCNGLSINAQAALLLYLPLDGDTMDHSGMLRDGLAASGYTEPQFTCLDKSVNCSALFMGNQCIQVPSLAQTQFGRPTAAATIPRATFSIFFKRISGSTDKQGIFGNSIDSNNATWRIQTGAPALNYVSAGIRTDNEPALNPAALDDFIYTARDNMWHQAVMSYDGEDNILNNKIPTTMFYMDEEPAPGNTLLNRGDIGIRNQPVSIGCVMNENFVGFLDEARIFNDVLSIYDVRALRAMRDVNFW